MLSVLERMYCNWLAGAQDGWCYDSYVKIKTNPELLAKHKPQVEPQSHNHHGDVRKNVIRNTLGETRSIAYCKNRLVNRKKAIVVELILHVGTKEK